MIYRVAAKPYVLPFRHALRTAHGVWGQREGLILRLESAEGGVGFGEAAPIPWFGTENLATIRDVVGSWGERVRGRELAALPAELGCLRRAVALAEAGIHDEQPAMIHDSVPVAALLPAGRMALELLEPRAELGFRTFKWKVGVGDPADERAMLDDLLGALPKGAKLRLDANGAWSRREAERWLAHCAERPIDFVEQPLAPDLPGAEDYLRGWSEDLPVAIGLDESVVTETQVQGWLDRDWQGVWVIKPALGGWTAMTAAALQKTRARVVFSSSLETRVGAVAALREALAWPDFGRSRDAVGFGVVPWFADYQFDAPGGGGPFVTAEDITTFDPEALWNALP